MINEHGFPLGLKLLFEVVIGGYISETPERRVHGDCGDGHEIYFAVFSSANFLAFLSMGHP